MYKNKKDRLHTEEQKKVAREYFKQMRSYLGPDITKADINSINLGHQEKEFFEKMSELFFKRFS